MMRIFRELQLSCMSRIFLRHHYIIDLLVLKRRTWRYPRRSRTNIILSSLRSPPNHHRPLHPFHPPSPLSTHHPESLAPTTRVIYFPSSTCSLFSFPFPYPTHPVNVVILFYRSCSLRFIITYPPTYGYGSIWVLVYLYILSYIYTL